MSVFVCDQCGSIEELELVLSGSVVEPGSRMLCSACLPVGVAQGGFRAGTGQWHNQFPRRPFDPEQDVPVNRPTGLGFGAF